MKLLTFFFVSLFCSLSFALDIGEKAPFFTLDGLQGKVSLEDFKGKIIVLEWLNHGCPFVRKHYDSGNMQRLQKKYTTKGVIWLSVISSAPGKQGYVEKKEALEDKNQNKSFATDILLDPTGKVGKLFEAKTTPHLFILNKEGHLVYQGAIDDKPDTKKESIPNAKNFLAKALDEVLENKKVTRSKTTAYGCSVKY